MNLLLPRVEKFLYREARYLDDRDWTNWLELYTPEAEFWMPAWDDNDELVTDPAKEISLIYYPDRTGLEDRVFRIRTERSSATSLPEPRVCHNLSNIEVLGETADRAFEVRFNWITLSYRYKTVDTYFGTSFYRLQEIEDDFRITRKKIVLKNDYIHHVIDVYHV